MKLFLDAHGQPTYPWIWIVHPGRLLLATIGTAVWAAPFFGLALLALWLQRLPPRPWLTAGDRWLITWGGMLAGLWGEVRLFVEVFWQWDPIALFAGFLLATQYVPHVLAGLAAGALAVVGRHAGRRLVARVRTGPGRR